MSFKIVQQDMRQAYGIFKKNLSELQQHICESQNKLNQFVCNDQFSGAAAESMKAYMGEVHGTLLKEFDSIAENMQERMHSYVSDMFKLDTNADFVLPQEAIMECAEKVYSTTIHSIDAQNEINGIFNGISSIITLGQIQSQDMADATIAVKNRADQLCRAVYSCENRHYNYTLLPNAHISQLRSCVNQIGVGEFADIGNYEKGNFEKLAEAKQLGAFSRFLEIVKDQEISDEEQEELKKSGIADIVLENIKIEDVELNGPVKEVFIAPNLSVYCQMKGNTGEISAEDIRTGFKKTRDALKNGNANSESGNSKPEVSFDKENGLSIKTKNGDIHTISVGRFNDSYKYQASDGTSIEIKYYQDQTKSSIEENVTVPVNNGKLQTIYGLSLYNSSMGSLQPEAATERMSKAETLKRIKELEDTAQNLLKVYPALKMAEGIAAIAIFAIEFLPGILPVIAKPVSEVFASIDWNTILNLPNIILNNS